jgi:ABC-type antimicrobial peptide transport system permease subunit
MPDSAPSAPAMKQAEAGAKRSRQGSGNRMHANFSSAISALRVQRRYGFQAIASVSSAAMVVIAMYILLQYANILLHLHLNVPVRMIILASISAIAFAAGDLLMMKILFTMGRKRSREFGIRLVVGARRCDIRNQLFFEVLFLSVVGGVLGSACGLYISFLVTWLLQLPFIVKPILLLILIGISIVSGTICGFYAVRIVLGQDFVSVLCND